VSQSALGRQFLQRASTAVAEGIRKRVLTDLHGLTYCRLFVPTYLSRVMKILAIEADELTVKNLVAALSSQYYAVEVASDGETGWEFVQAFAYDLVLVNVRLPDMDGISLCQQIRAGGYTMPILLLTERRDNRDDRLRGLDAGADDTYSLEPFDVEDLLARMRALLRRGVSTVLPVLEWGDLRLDPSTCEVTYSGQPLALTPKEYALLELFLRNSHRVFSCAAILDRLWAFQDVPGEYAVRTHIKDLRHRLKVAGAPADTIETVYGIGYRLKQKDIPISAPNADPGRDPIRQQTLTAIAGVWSRFQGRIRQQVEILEQATDALLKQALDLELRQQAECEAHTLAGSLGTFGLMKGSHLARKIERRLQADRIWEEREARGLCELVKALRQEIYRSSPHRVCDPAVHPDKRPLLLVVDRDRPLASTLAREAQGWGLRSQIVSSLSTARKSIELEPPNIVLLDLDISRSAEDSLNFLAKLTHHTPPIPVLVFTKRDGLTERLEVARAGGSTFLPKPMLPGQVLELVAQVLHRADPPDARVMVVDDDPKILEILRTLLEPWGLKVTTLDDPRRFWETLAAVSPNLLVVDLKMPHISGIELCQIVRNDARWGGLPIVCLTDRTDTTTIERVFAVGVDDFVSKPIVGPELVARILNRLERFKLLQRLAQTNARD
jgi:DNA-binding response OmpR family regulator